MKHDMTLLYQKILNEQAVSDREAEKIRDKMERDAETGESGNIVISTRKVLFWTAIGIGALLVGYGMYKIPSWLRGVAEANGLRTRWDAVKFLSYEAVKSATGEFGQKAFPSLSKKITELQKYGRQDLATKTAKQIEDKYQMSVANFRLFLDELGHIKWSILAENVTEITRAKYLAGEISLDKYLAIEGSFATGPRTTMIGRIWMPILQKANLGQLRMGSLMSFGTMNPINFTNYLGDGARRLRLLTRFEKEFARLTPGVALPLRIAARNPMLSTSNRDVKLWVDNVYINAQQGAKRMQISKEVLDLANRGRGGKFPSYNKWRAVQHISRKPSAYEAQQGYDDYKMQKLLYILWHGSV